ncbi:MAG: amino acid permease [Acidobacteria bacterium]|nr:amino acid permease [Acidobacteriota bacterium]MBI3280095.1 amino acid permease [Acidobacteriota bacterium]
MPERTTIELKRDLGVWASLAIVVGTVIGSGIFLVPKAMIREVGSAEMVFAVWIFGGLLSLFGALTYAELAAALPEAGGEYVYLREAYGPFFGFLYGWTQTWVAKSASIAALATAFFYYLANFNPGLEAVLISGPRGLGPRGGPLEIRYGQLLAIAVILLLAFINYFGVKLGGRIQVATTVVKVSLIAGIVLIGLSAGQGSAANLGSQIPARGGAAGFFAALVAALWAYDGWNNVNMVAAEIRNPQRNLPRALIGGTLLVIVIYLVTNVAYFYVLTAGEVGASDRVAAEMMRHVLGAPGADAVSVAAMISILAALNGSVLSGSRIPYAQARDGLFFRRLANVHPRYRTPGASILMLSGWAALLVLSGRYEELYTLVIFPSWILYGMAAGSVLVLRRKRPDLERPYLTLGYPVVPVLFVCAALLLLLYTVYNSPRESLLGLSIIFVGIPFYFRWRRRLLL